MRALRVERLTDDLSGCAIRDIDAPEPGPGEVQVRVEAVSLNFPDLLMTRGAYQLKPPLPFTPGLDVAGVVIGRGPGADRFALGSSVVGGVRLGGMAEIVCVPQTALSPKPETLGFPEAAAYPAAYLTAYVALVRRARAQPGEWLLVHGASGGVGLAAVDLGRVLGLRVIAAAASPEKLKIVAEACGPEAVVVNAPGFREEVKALTGGRGADIIFDPVGGAVFDESVRCIAFDGRLLAIGFASGTLPTLPVNLALIKGFSLMGVRAGEYGRQFPDRGRENVEAVAALAASGAIRPRVHAVWPMQDWRAAFDAMTARTLVGKAVLLP